MHGIGQILLEIDRGRRKAEEQGAYNDERTKNVQHIGSTSNHQFYNVPMNKHEKIPMNQSQLPESSCCALSMFCDFLCFPAQSRDSCYGGCGQVVKTSNIELGKLRVK